MTNTLYRIENPSTEVGLWYSLDGTKTDFIKSVPEALSADLPMDFDPELAGGWFSACTNLEQLNNWFTAEDLLRLNEKGYGLYEITAEVTKILPHHSIFRKEYATSVQRPLSLLVGV